VNSSLTARRAPIRAWHHQQQRRNNYAKIQHSDYWDVGRIAAGIEDDVWRTQRHFRFVSSFFAMHKARKSAIGRSADLFIEARMIEKLENEIDKPKSALQFAH
jgi:hypothetical protein